MADRLYEADLNHLKGLVDTSMSGGTDNREAYYSYLSDKGYQYGELAGGVVAEDSFSGRMANVFLAQSAVANGMSINFETSLQISKDLMQADLKARVIELGEQGYSDTLSARDHYANHKAVFGKSDYGLGVENWGAAEPIEYYIENHVALGFSDEDTAADFIMQSMMNANSVDGMVAFARNIYAHENPDGTYVDNGSLDDLVDWTGFLTNASFTHFDYLTGPIGAFQTPFGECFVADTPVSLWTTASSLNETGTENPLSKPIQDIVVGDVVVSHDANGTPQPGRVVRVFRNVTDEIVQLIFPDDRPDLHTTPGHRFRTVTGDFVEIGTLAKLHNGSPQLVGMAGETITVQAKILKFSSETAHLFETVEKSATLQAVGAEVSFDPQVGWGTYNFEVKDLHTYVAGGIQVHNDSVFWTTLDNGVEKQHYFPFAELDEDGTVTRADGSVAAWTNADGTKGVTNSESYYTKEHLDNYGVITDDGIARVTFSGAARILADTLGFDGSFGVDGTFAKPNEGNRETTSNTDTSGSGSHSSTSGSAGSFGDAVKSAWNTVKTAISNAWSATKNFFGFGDPVVLDLDGDGVEVLAGRDTFFDMDGDGYIESTSWAAPDDGFLIVDLNNNGSVDQTNELILSNLGNEGDTDLQALARVYDQQSAGQSGHGVLNQFDTNVWSMLKVWKDANSNGISDAGEVQSLAHYGITEIGLIYDDGRAYNDTGNDLTVLNNSLLGSATFKHDGSTLGFGDYSNGLYAVSGGVGDVRLTYGEIGFKKTETSYGHELQVEGALEAGTKTYLDLSKSASADTVVEPDAYNGVYGDDRDNTVDAASSTQDMLISGGTGNDTLIGGGGSDLLVGGIGNDTLIGGLGADILDGQGGRDTASYVGSDAAVTIDLREGFGTGGHGEGDTLHNIENLFGSTFGDTLNGSSGANIIHSGNGNDKVYGREGDDIVYLGLGNDVSAGGDGNDQIFGGGGNDRVYGNDGDDELYGGGGNDRLYGHKHNDTLYGGAGRDTLKGGDHDDHLDGGEGNDRISGDMGADRLIGGKGNDTMTGGGTASFGRSLLDASQDIFVFNENDGADVIKDFKDGEDLIEFTIAGLNFADLSITDTDNGAQITYDNDDTIMLSNVTANLLTQEDFIFA